MKSASGAGSLRCLDFAGDLVIAPNRGRGIHELLGRNEALFELPSNQTESGMSTDNAKG